MKRKIAITMGEPGGIGPEVLVKALSHNEVKKCCTPVVIGDYMTLKEALTLTGEALSFKKIQAIEEAEQVEEIPLLEPFSSKEGFVKGRPSRQAGTAVYEYIRTGVQLTLDGHIDALVTGPISKESLKSAGLPWPGHTELLAELTRTKDFTMMLIGGPLRVILVTIHAALRDVPSLVTRKKVAQTISLAKKAAQMLNLENPRIGVAGLNPHAGEAGMFGREEIEHIIPAIQDSREHGCELSGPYPPDIIFNLAYKGKLDIICTMYHDQGLIPLKMIAFDRGVNITVGLPIIRTSPDHGTAFGLAWKQNQADPSSMIEAITMAATLKIVR
jgi:4-hydroxythreonine-4-phosphate dehydrogenase